MKKLMMVAAVAAIACGCITNHKNDGGDACLKPAIAKDIVHEKFTVGKDPVTASDSINCLFGWICWGSSSTHIADAVCDGSGEKPILGIFDNKGIKQAKNGAYANACDAANCDQIVGAKYKVTTKDYFVFKQISTDFKMKICYSVIMFK